MFYELINHNSALIFVVVFVTLASFYAWRNKKNLAILSTLIMLIILVLFSYSYTQYGTSDVNKIEELDVLMELESPIIVQIYSDSCGMCLISKNTVDRLDQNIRADISLIRLNIAEDIGKSVARRYRVTSTPTFLVFDSSGNVVFRHSGYPDIAKLENAARNLISS